MFSFSLHHVPAADHPALFAEVRRVLRPSGFLCAIEPAGGPLNEVMRLFHDEEQVRAQAQASLAALAVPAFEQHVRFRYHSMIRYDSFDAFADAVGGRTFNSGYSAEDVRRPEVEAAFRRHGSPDHAFASPKVMMFLQQLRAE